MSAPFDRDRLCKLLGLLGSAHDGEVLNAARRIDAMVRAADLSWSDLLTQPTPAAADEDLRRLDDLIACAHVDGILKRRLREMRAALRRGRLGDSDRQLLRILHRKAVIDGIVVVA